MTIAQQLKDALTSHGGIEGVRVVAKNDVHDILSVEEKISSIGKLNNFAFDLSDNFTAWRAYGIGDGKGIPLAKNLTGT